MHTLYLILSLSSIAAPELSTSERAARVAESYQPQQPRIAYAYHSRCVITHDASGKPESKRCGL